MLLYKLLLFLSCMSLVVDSSSDALRQAEYARKQRRRNSFIAFRRTSVVELEQAPKQTPRRVSQLDSSSMQSEDLNGTANDSEIETEESQLKQLTEEIQTLEKEVQRLKARYRGVESIWFKSHRNLTHKLNKTSLALKITNNKTKSAVNSKHS